MFAVASDVTNTYYATSYFLGDEMHRERCFPFFRYFLQKSAGTVPGIVILMRADIQLQIKKQD